MELEYFTSVITTYWLYNDNGFQDCSNLETLGTKNILYYDRGARGDSFGYSNCKKIDHLTTYNFIGQANGSANTGAFQNMSLRYLLLPRFSGLRGNGYVSLNYSAGNKFMDFGALIKTMYRAWYNIPQCVVLRSPIKVSMEGGNGNDIQKLYVPSNLVSEYLADTAWQQNVRKVGDVYQVFAIGGDEWQEQFASTSNPASEYADVEYYAPELYDEYVEGYEESKATANAQL